ncbi:MAG: sigma-70 family RNA polymerase sigma factor [Flavobacteriaceae bacterium]
MASQFASPPLLEDLLTRVAAGDGEACADLYDRASAKLYGVILRILQDRALCEDVLQECFVTIWQKAGSFDIERGSAIAWMSTIARNRAIDVKRAAKPASANIALEEAGDTDAALIERMPDIAGAQALRRCLEGLDEEDRQMVVMAYVAGYSREELASRHERPVGTIKVRLHRALAGLRGCLGDAR